ncbi:MAG TPA: DHA2 family efflux MFS transporter permease subunit [Xanthobacteraceae bacterium]|nr:DHA2 family efflux MFS transporter permease subunit [Xanthobacteraceae bacterium]
MLMHRIVPLIVAVALFMENMDSTVIATALPAIAADLQTNPLALKLAITSYLLALAIFIPASGWTADRFGARNVFRLAIAVFMTGSLGCAIAHSLDDFVVARFVQGIGGAMMSPIGRLVLLRSFDKRELVKVMVWVTTPALIGPMLGPPVGGFITTYFSWHWIFVINIPMGLIGIVLATRYIPDIRGEERVPFDFVGFVLAGLGIGGLAFGATSIGIGYLPVEFVLAMLAIGMLAGVGYLIHSRRTATPLLDLTLFSLPTFSASVLGGFMFRVGVGALPFLLPLLLQLGFRMTPFQSGLITFSTAIGAMSMKAVVPSILSRFGFRNTLVVNAVISAAFLAACAAFTPATPVAVIIVVLVVGGFFRSLEFTCINTIAYADVDRRRMSRATSLVSVAQQLSIATGVAVGALAVEVTTRHSEGTGIGAADFPPAFLLVGAISAASALVFMRLAPDAGHELAGRTPGPTEPTDQRMG